MQKYLKSEEIPVNEVQNLFRHRVSKIIIEGKYSDIFKQKYPPISLELGSKYPS